MKAIKLVAILAIMLTSFSVRAVCPTQQTTIFFINGVDNTIDDAKLSRGELATALKSRGVNLDCVTVKLAYNKSENRIADFSEASRQKTLEAGLTATNFWEMFERLIPSQNWFVEQFRTAMSTEAVLYDARDAAIFDQINEHIDTLYRLEPPENQLLFVAHSQGNLFANEERLGMLERFPQVGARVDMVSVATPANNVAGATAPYTTISEDKLMANVIGALVPNLTNGATSGPCSISGGLDEYVCHGWIESYMVPESKSRKEIMNDIIAALPAAPQTADTVDFSNLFYGAGALTGNSFVANIPVGTNLVFAGLAYVDADGDFPKSSAPWYRFGSDDTCDIPGTIANGVYSHTLSSNMSGLCSGRNPTYFYDVLGYQVGNVRYITAVYKFHNAGTISAPVWEFAAP